MRYEFVGQKTPYVGKTLWEIVGNLKNFGVGRLVRKNFGNSFSEMQPELAFLKILKVQPVPPGKQFENRRVIVWVEEFFKGQKKPVRPIFRVTEMARFQLIPKTEGEEYLKKAVTLKPPVKYIKKYYYCPPLYKRLWEAENLDKGQMPQLKTVYKEYESFEVVEVDEENSPDTCSLYKTDMTVDEMYKEIVRLKKIINSNTDVQQ